MRLPWKCVPLHVSSLRSHCCACGASHPSPRVQVADRILAAAPGDSDALHAKVLCLIELGKVEESLAIIESNPAIAETCSFERAYCLYSLKQDKESLALVMPQGKVPTEARDLQLAAQIKYRQGIFAEAVELFQQAERVGGVRMPPKPLPPLEVTTA